MAHDFGFSNGKKKFNSPSTSRTTNAAKWKRAVNLCARIVRLKLCICCLELFGRLRIITLIILMIIINSYGEISDRCRGGFFFSVFLWAIIGMDVRTSIDFARIVRHLRSNGWNTYFPHKWISRILGTICCQIQWKFLASMSHWNQSISILFPFDEYAQRTSRRPKRANCRVFFLYFSLLSSGRHFFSVNHAAFILYWWLYVLMVAASNIFMRTVLDKIAFYFYQRLHCDAKVSNESMCHGVLFKSESVSCAEHNGLIQSVCISTIRSKKITKYK